MQKLDPTIREVSSHPWMRRGFGTLLLGCLLQCACHNAAAPAADAKPAAGAKPQAAAKPDADAKESASEGVSLTPDQVEKLGVVTQAAAATDYSEEAAGFGVVVNHETIAQAAAELATAQATERLSRSALARAKKLSGTPGAVSADVEETAAQKAEVDAAALTLTTRRLSSMLGMNPPWKNGDRGAMLQELAARRFDSAPVYVLREEGPDHAKRFYATVLVGGDAVGSGEGSSKKQAEQSAARLAVECLADGLHRA